MKYIRDHRVTYLQADNGTRFVVLPKLQRDIAVYNPEHGYTMLRKHWSLAETAAHLNKLMGV